MLEEPEQCDDGNQADGDGCDGNCSLTACGNGIVTSGEACDLGVANARVADTCRPTCVLPRCGDGILDPLAGEACDDENQVDGDGCDSNCTESACGNGVLSSSEKCDDGNQVDGDGCEAGCVPTGWLFDGTASPVCGTQDGNLLLTYLLYGDPGYEAFHVQTGERIRIAPDSINCAGSAVLVNAPTASVLSSHHGRRSLQGSSEVSFVGEGETWTLGVGAVGPEGALPYRLREYSLDGDFSEVESWCHPRAVYAGGKGISPFCPDPLTLQVITWSPGELEAHVVIPVVEFEVAAWPPNPALLFGTEGKRVALMELETNSLWDISLDGFVPATLLSQNFRWAALSPDEERLIYVSPENSLMRHSSGAAASVTLATGLTSQSHPDSGSRSADWFRASRDLRWVTFHRLDPELQLYITSVDDPTQERPISVGASQKAPWRSFTDDSSHLLYRTPQGVYAQPVAGGSALLVDDSIAEIFTLGGTSIAWTRRTTSESYTGELRSMDLASSAHYKVVNQDVVAAGILGPVPIGPHGLAYSVSIPTGNGSMDSVWLAEDAR